MKARDVLNKYKHMPSFQGIHSDCEAIVLELMQCLRDQLRNPEVGRLYGWKELLTTIELLTNI